LAALSLLLRGALGPGLAGLCLKAALQQHIQWWCLCCRPRTQGA